MDRFDLLVVGGGINGASIARDAAGRGLRKAVSRRSVGGEFSVVELAARAAVISR